MGWQSPQPGHQSAGSLRKHLRELGRQLKGADWHYRKVTRSTLCLTQQFVFLQTLRGGSGDRHRPASLGRHRRAQARLARAAGHAPGQRSALLQLFSPPCFPTCEPGDTHPRRAIHIATAWQKVSTSTSYHIQKGSKEEALPTKITPLASNYTARAAHRPSSAPKRKQTPAHSSHTAVTSFAKSHQKSSLPFAGGVQANRSPQPRTSCQICPASPPTCDLHRLLIVQAVAAASFRDLCPKGCLQKQVSEPTCAQRSKKRTNNMMQKVNRCKVSAKFYSSLCHSWSTTT